MVKIKVQLYRIRSQFEMLLQLKKSCIDTIEHALTTIRHTRPQPTSKQTQQKLTSIQNDLELLKDNFTLFLTKICRLQSKCHQKDQLIHQIQLHSKLQFQDLSEMHRVLNAKCEKLKKELNFFKFNNHNLKNKIESLNRQSITNAILKKQIKNIQQLILNSGQNLQSNINKIILRVQQVQNQQNKVIEKPFQIEQLPQKDPSLNKIQSPQNTFHLKKQQTLNPQNCPLKIAIDGYSTDRQHHSTIKKTHRSNQNLQNKQSLSTDRKKRNQLARLVEQQGRLARINERYLSTNLF